VKAMGSRPNIVKKKKKNPERSAECGKLNKTRTEKHWTLMVF
jgi:hypothetical protein